MSAIKADKHQIGSSSTNSKNIVVTTNTNGDLVYYRGVWDAPTQWVELVRVSNDGWLIPSSGVKTASKMQTFVATSGQTVFTLDIANSYIPNSNHIAVYINGVRQHPDAITEPTLVISNGNPVSVTQFTLDEGVVDGSTVLAVIGESYAPLIQAQLYGDKGSLTIKPALSPNRLQWVDSDGNELMRLTESYGSFHWGAKQTGVVTLSAGTATVISVPNSSAEQTVVISAKNLGAATLVRTSPGVFAALENNDKIRITHPTASGSEQFYWQIM